MESSELCLLTLLLQMKPFAAGNNTSGSRPESDSHALFPALLSDREEIIWLFLISKYLVTLSEHS